MLFPLLALLLAFGSPSFAGEIGDGIPGNIPLRAGAVPAASDLIYQGKALTPDQADKLAAKTDLSLLEPRAGTDIYPGQPTRSERLKFSAGKPFRFIDEVPTLSGRYLFAVTQDTPDGPRQFSILLGLTARNVLYQKALLEKIGYRVPPAEWLAKAHLEFESSISRDRFTRAIFDGTLADPARWAKNSGERALDLQDVLIFERSQSDMYNLSLGYMPADRVSDRRLLRALAVPYELLNIPESVNLLHWNFGLVASNHLALTFDGADQFRGDYEDARWIARKIAKLTRKDFQEIASAGRAPKVVQELLVEKLIARRNDMLKVLKLSTAALPVNAGVSDGAGLKHGQVLQTTWPGYASSFGNGPSKESPFRSEQLVSLLKSKVVANLISNGVSYFNSDILPTVNLAEIVRKKETDALAHQFIDYVKTGEVKPLPLKAYLIPFPSANLIASRDVVIGSYLGTDNKVQLADTVGVNANLGAYIGVLGLPAQWNVSGQIMGSYTRTYTHIRPLSDLKTVEKYPFKNMVVPLFNYDVAQVIDGFSSRPSPEQTERLKKVVGQLKDQLLLNESLIVTDSVGPQFTATAGYGVAPFTEVFASFSAQQTLISRIHITRTGEDEIQIYKDFGNSAGMGVSFGLAALAPVITLDFSGNIGKAKTKFYRVPLNTNDDTNTDLAVNLKALRNILLTQDFEALDYAQKPVVLDSRFKQVRSGLNALFFRDQALDSSLLIQASRESAGRQEKIKLVHFNSQKMQGNDFQSLLLNVLNGSIAQFANAPSLAITSTSNGRTADTIFGSSVLQQASFDAILDGKKVSSPFLSLATDWAGWHLSKAGAEDILQEISRIVGTRLYPKYVFQNTKALDLYDINLYVNIYEGGIKYFLALDLEQVHRILDPENKAYSEIPGEIPGERARYLEQVYTLVLGIRKAAESGDRDTLTRKLMQVAQLVELSQGVPTLTKLFGGSKNVMAGSSIRGFRDGAEDAEEQLLGNTVGELGSPQFGGPLESVRKNVGATPSEFYLLWIMGRL